MAYLERMGYTQDIPAHAVIRTEKGEQYACWKDRNGQQVKALVLPSGKCRRYVTGKWIGVYRDHKGRKQKTPPFSDKNHARMMAIQLERQEQAVREGRVPAGRPVGKVEMADAVPKYVEYMKREGFAETHVTASEQLVRRIITRHGLTTPGRVDAEELAGHLEEDRLAGRGKEGSEPFSLRTRNWWTATLKAFGEWLKSTKRADINPFADLPLGNAKKDRRHVRRPIDVDDLTRLVIAARDGDEYQGISGPDRAALYTLAMYTGLRAGALFRLTPENFRWKGETLAAVYSTARAQKSGEDHGVPISPSVAKELGDWLRGKPPGQLLFRKPSGSRARTARLIRHDLAAAGIPYRGPDGRVCDFHALRRSFGVMSAKSNVALVFTQQLMQHSTPVLTANVYSDVGGELADEVAKLPSLGAALGANGLRPGKSNVKSPPAKKGANAKKTHGNK